MIVRMFKSFIDDDSGATAIEYGLIAALVSVAAIVALGNMGTALSDMFGTVSDKLTSASTNAPGEDEEEDVTP